MSVTDRCNFRCTYCMPKEIFGHDFAFLPKADILSYEELERLAAAFVKLGIEKIRLTGGEPLLRRDLPHLIARLKALPGLREVALTTNGSALATQAHALRQAGLDRLTVSLDALDDAIFRSMNDVDFPVHRVLQGIRIALEAGFPQVKINMVVKRGTNEDQILPMAQHFRTSQTVLRFIEFMDVGQTNGWSMTDVLPAAEIHQLIHAVHPLEPISAPSLGRVAERYRYADGASEIGIIASVTAPFCSGCTRARVAADGQFYTCLFAHSGHDLRSILRSTEDEAALTTAIRSIWSARVDRYSEARTAATQALPRIEMSRMGG
jgi:GTP 3',8-cyclase